MKFGPFGRKPFVGEPRREADKALSKIRGGGAPRKRGHVRKGTDVASGTVGKNKPVVNKTVKPTKYWQKKKKEGQ